MHRQHPSCSRKPWPARESQQSVCGCVDIDDHHQFKVIISEQINMNLSIDTGKNSFVSLQFCVGFFYCVLNIIPIALIALEATIERRRVL